MPVDQIEHARRVILHSSNSVLSNPLLDVIAKLGMGDATAGSTKAQITKDEDEAKLIEALRQLDTMHTKLINLRSSIPRMIHPITTASTFSSPETLFDEFSKRALLASEEVVEFTTAMVENKWVFERAIASRSEDPEGIKRWKMSSARPAYLDGDASAGAAAVLVAGTKRKAGKIGEDEDVNMLDAAKERKGVTAVTEEVDDYREVISAFVKEHADQEVVYDDEKREIRITLPKPASFKFTIEISDTAVGRRYIVSTPHTSHLSISILRSITTRPNPESLRFLLDMISHYSTIYSTKCEKCKHLTGGPKAELPVVRRLVVNVKMVKNIKSEQKESVEGKATDVEMAKDESKDGDVEMKDDSVEVGEKKDETKDVKKEKKEDGEENEEDEVEVTEEKWIAFHEGCVD